MLKYIDYSKLTLYDREYLDFCNIDNSTKHSNTYKNGFRYDTDVILTRAIYCTVYWLVIADEWGIIKLLAESLDLLESCSYLVLINYFIPNPSSNINGVFQLIPLEQFSVGVKLYKNNIKQFVRCAWKIKTLLRGFRRVITQPWLNTIWRIFW